MSPSDTSDRRGLAIALSVCGLIGAATVGSTLALSGGGEERRAGAAATIATEEYGRRLLVDTARLMGPDHDGPAMRYKSLTH